MHPSDRELLIAWSLLPFLSPARTRLLLEYFDPPSKALDASPAVLEGLLSVTRDQASAVKHPLTLDVLDRVRALSSSVIVLGDPAYPRLLAEIVDPPLAIHFRGDAALLDAPCVAIVGSRRASPYAINVARFLSRQLVSAGLTIVSGLARGVDAAAHSSALESGGRTIAVLGTGIDIVYPRSNAALFREIGASGLLLTEFAPATPPLPENFPVRNRVISGLCAGTVIVEATGRSGSLITARMAAEQGREVFAVPGSIFAAGSEGTHRLIQYGAKLVHDATDILDELPGDLRLPASTPPVPPAPELRQVLEALSADDGTHVDSLSSTLRRTTGEVAEALLQLELGGWVRAVPGGRYVRTK